MLLICLLCVDESLWTWVSCRNHLHEQICSEVACMRDRMWGMYESSLALNFLFGMNKVKELFGARESKAFHAKAQIDSTTANVEHQLCLPRIDFWSCAFRISPSFSQKHTFIYRQQQLILRYSPNNELTTGLCDEAGFILGEVTSGLTPGFSRHVSHAERLCSKGISGYKRTAHWPVRY